jgi:hypothetical protein
MGYLMVLPLTSALAKEPNHFRQLAQLIKFVALAAITRSPELQSLKLYRYDFGHFPNVLFPKTFNEKVQARKIFDRRSIYSLWADKVAVRDWVASKVGECVLPTLYHVTDTPTDIPFDKLPSRYVVKASHGSGWVRIVKDGNTVNRAAVISECEHWLGRSYCAEHHDRIYRDIKPQILIEEFLDNGAGEVAEDFKFYVFDGNVRIIQIDSARFGAHRRNIYDRDWNLLPVRLTVQTLGYDIERPTMLEPMIALAERLSGGIDFVRVDLYQASVGVRFGEMTPSSGNGLNKFTPESFDEVMGGYWRVRT